VTRGKGDETSNDAVELRDGQTRRHGERQERQAGLGAHGGQIAQIHRKGSMPDRLSGREAAVKVHAFDQRVRT